MIPQPTEVPAEHHALRILVVEDNLLIAETICDMVADCGCAVIGPAPNLSQGLALLDQNSPDGALLDINLGGDLSFPLAKILAERGVPFVFMTGYDEGILFPPEFRGVRRISKPFDAQHVAEVIEVWGRMAGT
jgi:CheY-like chemotaxis protein